jgi:hypothetical protein
VLREPGAQTPSAAIPDEAAPSRPGHLSQAGVPAVPPGRPGPEASALPEAYRDLLEVAQDAGRPLRAAQIAAAAGLSTGKAKVETLRSKLKRLAKRGWLTEEAGPGLFGLPARTDAGQAPSPGLWQGRALLPRFEGANRHEPSGKRALWNRMPNQGCRSLRCLDEAGHRAGR